MENLKHPHIAQNIICPELEDQIKAAFQRNLENGTDFTSTRFRQSLDSYVKNLISTPKGMSALNSKSNDIKSHFCRGRKWVVIEKEHALFETIIKVTEDNNFEDLAVLFNKNQKAHVRFHSAASNGVNFSIHPNSSESSKTKVLVEIETAMSLEIISGTPKSCGLEGEVKKKKPKVKAEIAQEAAVEVQSEETPINITNQEEFHNDETIAKLEPDTEVNEVIEMVIESPTESQLITDETSMEEWEQILSDEGIDIDFSDDSFDRYDEENGI